jgi:plastocyanin domain-containing protein
MRTLILTMALAAFAGLAPVQKAAAQDALTTTIKDHRFEPAEIRVPAGKRISLTVINDDPTPEEFESPVLKVEKVIPGKSKAVVQFGPLTPGTYKFEGEFNSSTAKGVVIAE